jgi:polysaccharide pyruvyl transferase CsaB
VVGSSYRIGVTGSYGGLNLGDEAILQVVLEELRRNIPDVEVTVFSRSADDTRARHPWTRAIEVRELSRSEVLPEIERLDLMMLGGGGVLFDGEAELFVRELLLAQEVGVPTVVYGVGAGPLERPENRNLVRQAMEAARAVTVRERRALQVLESIGVRRSITVTSDPAFLLEPEPLPPDTMKRESLDSGRRLVGLSVREHGAAAPDLDEAYYHGLLANAADYMVERLDADLVFVPMERNVLDVQQSHRVIAQMAHAPRATVLKGDYTPGQIASLVGHFDFAVGMRLHFLIFAALQRVPFVALPYAGKVMGLLEAMEITAPPIQVVNPGRLIAHIDSSWDMRRDLSDRISRALPMMKERARENTAITLRLLEATPPRGAVASAG